MSIGTHEGRYVFGIVTPKPMDGWPYLVTLEMASDEFATGTCEWNGMKRTWYVKDVGDKWVPGIQRQ
jgi:hypothetical protein